MSLTARTAQHRHRTALTARERSQEDSDGTSDLCKQFDIDTFPTVLFFKYQSIVWRATGSAKMTGDMNEGLLYFSESPKLKSADHVAEMSTRTEFDNFMADTSGSEAKVVMFTTPMCSPCIRVYPSYVTLGMNFKGLMDFGRVDIEDDEDADMNKLFKEQRIREVPTFVIYNKGVEVARDVSSHRGDLIGHILQTAMQLGIDPPKPKRR
jgi:thiol-disulfide isomerase/thioredoxin